jgi:hypothetical protein
LEHSYKTNPLKLREAVEFTVKHSGMGYVFDEAHFLFPAASCKDSPPTRLNWLRTQIVDKKLPVALVSTPQVYNHAAAKFIKATGYNLNQWTGRIVHQTILPDALEFDDLLAIVNLKCPEMDPDLRELIARRAGRSENYVWVVEAIGKRARFIARRDGHARITLEDVDIATAEVIPAPAEPPAKAPRPAAADAPSATRQTKAADTAPRPRLVCPATPAPALAIPSRDTGANLVPA